MRTWLALALCLTVADATAQDGPPKKPELPVVVYDLRDDLRPLTDRKPEALGFEVDQNNGPLFRDDQPDEPPTLDQWEAMVRDHVDPDQWDGEQRAVSRFAPGMLKIRAPKATHARIAAMLANYRARRNRRVRLELVVYRGSQRAAAALLAGGPLLDPRRLAALGRAPWTLVRRRALATHLAQGASRGTLERVRYLRGFTCEVAQASSIYEPQVRVLTLGQQDHVRPLLDVSGEGLLVRCRIASAQASKPFARFDTGVVTRERVKMLVEQPQLYRRLARTMVWMPRGGAAIVQLRGGGDHVELAILRHHAAREKVRPAGGSLRFLDVRALTEGRSDDVEEFVCGVGLVAPPKAHGIVREDQPDDANDGMRPDNLIEMIKQQQPEAWEQWAAGVSLLDGQLLILNKAKVIDAARSLLVKLERRLARTVFVRTRTIQAASDDRATWLADRAGAALSPADRAELQRALADPKQLKLLDDLGVSGMENRKALIEDAVSQPYVARYDVEIAELSSAHDPEIREATTGAALAMTPMSRASGRLRISLRRDRATLRKMTVVPSGSVRLQRPDVRLVPLQRDIEIASGGALLLATDKGHFLLVEAWRSARKK